MPLLQRFIVSFFETAPEGIVIQDEKGIVLRANPEFCRMFGYEAGEVVGHSLNELIADDEMLQDSIRLAGQEIDGRLSVETVRRRKDGSRIHVSIIGNSLDGTHGTHGYIIYRDITGRKQAERALIESEAKFRAIADTAAAAIYISNGSRILFANRATESISGYSRDELLRIDPFTLVAPESREVLQQHWIRRKSGQPVPATAEFKIVTKNGQQRWISLSGSMILFGGHEALLAVALDITGRKQAEWLQAALYDIARRANEASDLQTLFASIHNIVAGLLYADNFCITLKDEASGRLTSPYAVDEKGPGEEERRASDNLTEYVLRTGKPLLAGPDMLRSLAEDGKLDAASAPAAWLGVPLKTGAGPFGVLSVQSYAEGVCFSNQDQEILTFVGQHVAGAIGQKRSQESLKLSERRYRSLFQNAAYGIYRASADGSIADANPSLAGILGYQSPSELIGLNLERDIYADEWDRRRLLVQFRTEHRHVNDVRWKRKDGSLITVRLTGWRAQDSLADADGFEVIVEDVTEQRDLEEQLRHAQKMEAVGRLAGGLAHDFNNVLTIIKGYSDLLLDQFQQQDRPRAQLEEIRKAADRAAALTSQLQSFSHHQILSPRVLNLNQIVKGMEKMLRRLLGEDIDLKTMLDPFLGNLKADQGQIEQVIMNLVVNARDAMPHGGQLIIDTGNVTVGELSKSEQAALAPGRYIMLAITDTGIGMDAETRSHVFDPFFTTKQRGTGLGLATVYGVAKQTGGHTVISSEPGRGTTVKVYLPRVDEALEVRKSRGRETTEFHGTETILLVEDDDSLRPLVQQMLQQFGYTVLETGNSEQAMAVCERYQGPIHLLLTDVALQRKSGTELASRILTGRPEMRVLYMSGHCQDVILSHGISGANIPLIQKPFAVRDLAQKVREALDSAMG